MKLALLADIHSNLAALEAVTAHVEAWQPDAVVVAGDTVNRGPRPAECLRLVQAKAVEAGWRLVRGNHEDYVIGHAEPGSPRSGPWFETQYNSYWTYRQLNGDVAGLVAMPFQVSLPAPDGGEVRIVHASMFDNRNGIYPHTSDEELSRKIAPAPPLFGVGHTHLPLIRSLNGTLVVNAGSVGLPFDGDPRTGYARLEWRRDRWEAEIVRLDYDRARTERDFIESGFMTDSGPLADLILEEFHLARPRLSTWVGRYRSRVLAGEISLAESVQAVRSGS